MKRFRLATVERLRHQALDARAQELHGVGAERNRVTTERNRLATLLAGGVGYTTSTLFSGSDLELANNYRMLLRQEIQDHDDRIAELDEEVERARQAWLQARGKLRAVQALHDHHRAAVRAGTELDGDTARDLWMRIAEWQKNKVGDAKAAEAAYEAALIHDPTSEHILRSILWDLEPPPARKDT